MFTPKVIGDLYIREGVALGNLIFGAGQERGWPPETGNVPYIVALRKAFDMAGVNPEANSRHQLQMQQRMADGLIS